MGRRHDLPAVPAIVTAGALAFLLIWYLIGARLRAGNRGYFVGAWAILALALIGLDSSADRSFAGHMLQHELIMLGAAPLMVLARPIAPLLRPLPYVWRRRVGWLLTRSSVRAAWRALTMPAVAWVLQAAVIWAWHMPFLFERAVGNPWIHALQHFSFFVGAALFWWSVVHRGRRVAVLSLFTTAVHSGALGALLAFSNYSWYPAYAIDDQRLAGLIMWIPGGTVYLAAALLGIHRYLSVAPSTSNNGSLASLVTKA